MAGPVGSILLPQYLTPTQIQQMEAELRRISLRAERDTDDGFRFQVSTTQPFGGSYLDLDYGRPFGVTWESADAYREAEELFLLEEYFGFLPE